METQVESKKAPRQLSKVSVSKEQVEAASKAAGISSGQTQELWASLCEALGYSGPAFGMTTALYYFGGMIAIGAMSLFMTLGWASFGPWGLFMISLTNIAGLLFGAKKLDEKGYAVPAGILATLSVVMVPLAAWCAMCGLGLFPEGGHAGGKFSDYHQYIDWRWMFLEVSTLLAAALALRSFKLPFMVMPVAVTL